MKIGMNLVFLALIGIPVLSFSDGIPVHSVKGIRIVGFKGQVTLLGDPKLDKIYPKISSKRDGSDVWYPHVEVKDAYLEIRVSGSSSKADWSNVPPVSLEIRSAPLPTELTWKEGDLTIKNWHAPLVLSHRKGKIRVEEGGESLRISSFEGEVDIVKYAGRVEIDNYQARLGLKKVEGPLKIDNFQGKLSLSDSKGDLSLHNVRGKNLLEGIGGAFEFENIQGDITVTQNDGSIHGKALGGTVTAQLKGAVEVRIRGDDAKLSLALGKGHGARVDLGTEEGTLASQFPLKTERVDKFKLMKGQIPGSETSSIFVRLKNGETRIKSL